MRFLAILRSVWNQQTGKGPGKYLCMTISAVSNCLLPSLRMTQFLQNAMIQRKAEEYLLRLVRERSSLCLDTKGATLEVLQVQYSAAGWENRHFCRFEGLYLSIIWETRGVLLIFVPVYSAETCTILYCTVYCAVPLASVCDMLSSVHYWDLCFCTMLCCTALYCTAL